MNREITTRTTPAGRLVNLAAEAPPTPPASGLGAWRHPGNYNTLTVDHFKPYSTFLSGARMYLFNFLLQIRLISP